MNTEKPLNPYRYSTAVPHDLFFGRSYILRRLFSVLTGNQCISLVGSRYIGKSSIIKGISSPEIQKHFDFDSSHHILVFLSLGSCRNITCEEFFLLVTKEIINQARSLIQDLNVEPGGSEHHFSLLLDEIKARGFHLVLLMDAFDNVIRNEKFGPRFFVFLRSQALGEKVSYVTASVASLNKICHSEIEGSPFFNIFITYQIDAFTQAETDKLTKEPAQQAGLPFTDEEILWLQTQAGRHPFFLQYACSTLFDEKCIHGCGNINLPMLTDKIYHNLLSHFQAIWDKIEPKHQDILKQNTPGNNSIYQYPELTTSTLFLRFIHEHYHNSQVFLLTPEKIHYALKQLYNHHALGTTDLKNLTLVTQRIPPDATEAERGIIICAILKEALERMRGSGIRSDGASDWQFYNILHYRYFHKNRLKNEHVAARLEFSSLRQYYRGKNKALNNLLQELQEMENNPERKSGR